MSIKVAINDFTRKIKDFDTFTIMPKNVRDLGELIVAKGFKKFPKVQKIARSGHTGFRSKLKIRIVNKSFNTFVAV